MIITRDLKDKIDRLNDCVYWLQNHNEVDLEYNRPVLIRGCRFIAYRFQNNNGQLAIAKVSTGNPIINSAINIVNPFMIDFYLDFEEDYIINETQDFSQHSIYQSIYHLTVEKIKTLKSILIGFRLDNRKALEYAKDFLGRTYAPLFQLTDFLGRSLDKSELLGIFNQQLSDYDSQLTVNDLKAFETPKTL
jgi:hypothetical protein